MKNLITISIITVLLAMVSCEGNKKKDATSNESAVIDQLPEQNPPTISDSSSQSISVPVNDSRPSTPVVATGMNPAHGEPGHRCDIAVGAPLNSPPGNANNSTPAPATSSTPDMSGSGSVQTITSPQSGPTQAGMNPPHGEPGHDCTIAVGAPLKK